MSSLPEVELEKRPLIGVTTYRKSIGQLHLVAVAEAYTQAVVTAGGIPVMIPLGLDDAAWQQIYARVDGVLLPGGGDVDSHHYRQPPQVALRGVDPERDALELAVVRTAVADHKPLLAICRGHQVLNVALGGSLWQDLDLQGIGSAAHDFGDPFPRNHLAHTVQITPGSRLARILGREQLAVNSIHHQGIRDLAPGLTVTAVAEDGTIEGVELQEHPFIIGVQWHPESMFKNAPVMLSLFKELVTMAGRHHAANGQHQAVSGGH